MNFMQATVHREGQRFFSEVVMDRRCSSGTLPTELNDGRELHAGTSSKGTRSRQGLILAEAVANSPRPCQAPSSRSIFWVNIAISRSRQVIVVAFRTRCDGRVDSSRCEMPHCGSSQGRGVSLQVVGSGADGVAVIKRRTQDGYVGGQQRGIVCASRHLPAEVVKH